MSGNALNGVRILDFTQVLSGPFATMLLADAGADIVKIERPGVGDITRQWGPPFVRGESLYFTAFNRGKRSVMADLRDRTDRDNVRRLAERADVVIENLRPGTLDRFGLGYPDLERDCPRLIYLSICGYGPASLRVRDPALEVVLEAESGMMAITGNGEPVRQGIAAIDMMSGMIAVAKIFEGLYQRTRTGKGQHIVWSLEKTAHLMMTHPYLMDTVAQSSYPAMGTTHPSIAPYEHFLTADRPIILGAVNDLQFARLSDVMGHPEWCKGVWNTNAGRVASREELHQRLQSGLIKESAETWVNRLRGARLVVGVIRPLSEAVTQWQSTQHPALSSEDPAWGQVTYPASPWRPHGTVKRAPGLGESRMEDVLHRWCQPSEIEYGPGDA